MEEQGRLQQEEEEKSPGNLATIISDGLSAANGFEVKEEGEPTTTVTVLVDTDDPDVSCSSTPPPVILTTSPSPPAMKNEPPADVSSSPPPLHDPPVLSVSDPLGVTTQLTSELTLHPAAAAAVVATTVQQRPPLPPPPPSVPAAPAPCPLPTIPCGKITNYCPKHPHIEITLDGKELWDSFYRRGTEMIVNRAGRRMFPGFSVTITGLKPKAKYTMKLDVVQADNRRFKFLNARWVAVGGSEVQNPYETYVHPDSPNTGSFWMRHGVSFKKLKITNNKDKPGPNALLYSMHKYFLRLMIEEEKKITQGDSKQHQISTRPILSMEFPETTFMAVTAYQNEEVTQLKITNNPFAKAFRENATDMDWETAQALYGGSTSAYISPGAAAIAPTGSYNYLMSPSPSPWGIHSPMLSPHTFHTLTPQPHSIQGAGSSSHYSPDSVVATQFPRHPLPPTPQAEGFFQWPTAGSHRTSEFLSSTATYLPPLVSTYAPMHHHLIETSPPAAEGLPDFTSTFVAVTTTHS